MINRFRAFFVLDSRGNVSVTKPMVVMSCIIVLVKFAIGGLTINGYGPFPVITGTEFGAAMGAVLGLWWAREKTDKEFRK